ncbi:hypothetical protein ACHWQZ_G004132 [Mnemiopsis leidyi]
MFKSCYQGGVYVEIFSAQGKDPAAKWAQSGKVQRIFDKGVKSYVYMLEGGPSTKMQVPRDERQGLCLTQQFVVLQLSVPLGVGFNVQILATDTLNNKRRIFLSSAHRDISHTPLHTRLPMGMMTRGQWVNLAINVSSIVTGVFSTTFKSIELICISANCKLRKVFTMRHQPHNTNTGLYSPSYDGPTETIPKACTLNVGTTTQVIDMAVIRQWVENQQPKIQREAVTKSAPQNPLLRSRPVPRNAHSAEHQRKLQSSLDSASKQKSTVAKTKRQTKQQRLQQQTAANAAQRKTSGEVTSRGEDAKMQDHYAAPPEQKVAARGLAGHAREELRVREGTLVINGANRNSKVNNTNNHNSAGDVGAQVRTESEATDSIKHSTPNPLMDRVLDVSFDTIQSHVNLLQQGSNPDNIDNNVVGNRNMIKDIADGNVTFRSSSSSQRSSTTPGRSHRVTRVTTRRSREPSHSTSTSRRDPLNTSKVYNSKDYEDQDDNPFAASDEDLKYRMKALALYNGDLDESFDMSVVSRRSRRSHGVGPGGVDQSDDEIEEKLGEDTDTSSSDATVLSHAQEVLLSGSVGHTSFLQDSIGKNYESRLTDRAYSPPICYPDELTRQATLPQHTTTLNNPGTIEEDSGEEELDLLYDPVLNCYFDPKTCKYYELA